MCKCNGKVKRRGLQLLLTGLLSCAVIECDALAAQPPAQAAATQITETRVPFSAGQATLPQGEPGQPIVIRLRPVNAIPQRQVRLGHVAEILTGSQDQLKYRYLSDLDLLEIPEGQRLQLLEKSLIDVRLQLHGLRRSQYRLLGPDDVILSLPQSRVVQQTGSKEESKSTQQGNSHDQRQVEPGLKSGITPVSLSESRPTLQQFRQSQLVAEQPPEALTDLLVESSVQAALERQFALQPGDVRTQLLRPFVDTGLQQTAFTSQMRLEVVSPAEFPLGRTNILVRLWDGSQLISSRSAFVDVRRRRYILVCRKTIAQGAEINADDVAQEVRFVDSEQDELQIADVAQRTARRSIRPGEILSSRDLLNGLVAKSGKPVISARDSVRVTAYRKGMKFVVPGAEALQSGHVGQLIRVRNIHSSRILTGRVVAAGEVEVQLQ